MPARHGLTRQAASMCSCVEPLPGFHVGGAVLFEAVCEAVWGVRQRQRTRCQRTVDNGAPQCGGWVRRFPVVSVVGSCHGGWPVTGVDVCVDNAHEDETVQLAWYTSRQRDAAPDRQWRHRQRRRAGRWRKSGRKCWRRRWRRRRRRVVNDEHRRAH
eukprot:5368341-Prymnesium_polylepis.1